MKDNDDSIAMCAHTRCGTGTLALITLEMVT
jgi:hypothetical protein